MSRRVVDEEKNTFDLGLDAGLRATAGNRVDGISGEVDVGGRSLTFIAFRLGERWLPSALYACQMRRWWPWRL
jgi:hypothetical protein